MKRRQDKTKRIKGDREKKKEKEELEERRKKEQEAIDRDREILFHRKEDNEEPVSLYRPLVEAVAAAIHAGQGEALEGAMGPLLEEPPKYTPPQALTPTPQPRKHTRTAGSAGDWSTTLGKVLSPPTNTKIRPLGKDQTGAETYPLIALPNPRAGEQGQDPTMLVYRTWTQEDVKKAVEGITCPKEDVEECIESMRNLVRSYHLNGVELQQVWMTLLGPNWFHVKGNYEPFHNNAPTPADSQELQNRMDQLEGRIRERYRRVANYIEIGRCKQKPEEPFDEYRCMRIADSGLHLPSKEKDILIPDYLKGIVKVQQSTLRLLHQVYPHSSHQKIVRC